MYELGWAGPGWAKHLVCWTTVSIVPSFFWVSSFSMVSFFGLCSRLVGSSVFLSVFVLCVYWSIVYCSFPFVSIFFFFWVLLLWSSSVLFVLLGLFSFCSLPCCVRSSPVLFVLVFCIFLFVGFSFSSFASVFLSPPGPICLVLPPFCVCFVLGVPLFASPPFFVFSPLVFHQFFLRSLFFAPPVFFSLFSLYPSLL